ncbi:MAG: S41 family peptidase [Rhizomicrobium sp.]
MVPGARKPRDTAPAIQFLIGSLGEKHTFLIGSARWKAMTYGETAGTARGAAFGMLPVTNLMRDRIGYLALPGHDGSAADDAAYVAVLRNALRRFRAEGICRYVIDLRGNGGGNMFPMQAGLASLLGKRPYGYWDVGAGFAPVAWLDPEKVPRMDGTIAGPYVAAPADQSRAVVAVLVDRRTASSGEATAIAFEGRPHTRFIGEPTAGFTPAI